MGLNGQFFGQICLDVAFLSAKIIRIKLQPAPRGSGGRCPLDQEPFEQAKCGCYELAMRAMNAFKVYCWNETHGCEYEGTMEDMLRHYESECIFHSVECLRCGKAVLQKELAEHYVVGCSVPWLYIPAREDAIGFQSPDPGGRHCIL
ncbi:hypothetical protein MRX96_046963 [Rhipicephalus microplus]